MQCIITYQKQNGEILIRPCKFDYGKRVGEETSMGWKIVDIHYRHNDNYYCYHDFMKMFEKEIKEKHSKKLIRYIIKKLNKLA